MAETKDAHHVVVEIPVDEEHQQKLISAMTTVSAIQNHPLMEISQNPGHLLLLKLWQREEDLFGRRIAGKESRLNSIKTEIFQLCGFFFLFHGFFLTILSSTSTNKEHDRLCHKWWIPSILSISTSIVLIFLVQVKLCRYWKVSKQLQRERTDNRALTRCIQELRMKGASFDLAKEPLNGKRMKSSSVEIKWKPLTWCSQNLTTVCLVCVTDLDEDLDARPIFSSDIRKHQQSVLLREEAQDQFSHCHTILELIRSRCWNKKKHHQSVSFFLQRQSSSIL